MNILPNRFYHYCYNQSRFITKTYYSDSHTCWGQDVLRISGMEQSMTTWEFEKIVNQRKSPISEVYEVTAESHPELFI